MSMTSFGEVIGVLEREAKRVNELHEVAVALSRMKDDATTAERDLRAAQANVRTTTDTLKQLDVRVVSAKQKAVDAERSADERVAKARASADAEIVAIQAELDARGNGLKKAFEQQLQAAKAEAIAAKVQADQVKKEAEGVRVSSLAETATLVAQRDSLRAEIKRLQERIGAL